MEINWKAFFITIILFFTFTLTHFTSAVPPRTTPNPTEVNKPGKLERLCGKDFIERWKMMCKYQQYQRGHRNIRSITDIQKGGMELPILDKTKAQQFLRTLKRARRSISDIRDNANEECCHETCSYDEISEYSC